MIKETLLAGVLIAGVTLGSESASAMCADWPRCSKPELTEKVPAQPKRQAKKKVREIPVVDRVVGAIQSGLASFYWQPQPIACGRGRFNPEAMTAAHKTLPCGSRVKVTNKRNGKSVVVTINDRGPYVAGRIIDLSRAAARVINMESAGVVPVTVSRM